MKRTHNNNWKAYAMEAIGLSGFVILAGLLTIFFEHPNLPVMESWLKDYPTLRRIPLGIAIGLYVIVMTKTISETSGAHINPAVTWTFYRLGNIKLKDTIIYTVAQFCGAVAGSCLLKLTLDKWFGQPNIHYGVTKPIEPHTSTEAFIAEIIISFITMWVILTMSSSKKMEKKLPYIMGLLLAIFIIVEVPFSGMSMNPARSFAGAVAANKWDHLWIYFAAPIFAMLMAGELFVIWKRKKVVNRFLKPESEKDDLQKIKEFPAV